MDRQTHGSTYMSWQVDVYWSPLSLLVVFFIISRLMLTGAGLLLAGAGWADDSGGRELKRLSAEFQNASTDANEISTTEAAMPNGAGRETQVLRWSRREAALIAIC